MLEFCQEYGIAHEICGKTIVAVDSSELPALDRIYERGLANKVKCKIIDQSRLREIEPHAIGVRAIQVEETGIVDYVGVCRQLVDLLRQSGHSIQANAKVSKIRPQSGHSLLESNWETIRAKVVVNCAGLHSDRVTRLSGDKPSAQIIPFRGEYFKLKDSAKHLCKHLIYPVPDPNFPFLGVHFTRMVDGSIECGPNAVFAFAREGYHLSTVELRDMAESLTYPGFLRLAAKHWKMGMGEMWRSISKAAFVKALQRLMPEIQGSDLEVAPAGVRAQAVLPNGEMVDDFLIEETERHIHVINAPSPAATASLNIGLSVFEKIQRHLA